MKNLKEENIHELFYLGLILGVNIYQDDSLPKLFYKNDYPCDKSEKTSYRVLENLVDAGYAVLRNEYKVCPIFAATERGVKAFRKAFKSFVAVRGPKQRSLLDAMIHQEEDDMKRMLSGPQLTLEELKEKYKDFTKQ